MKTGADTKEAKTGLEEILRNSVNGCVHLLKGGEGPLGGMVTGQAFPSLGHAQHVNTIFTVSYRSAPLPPQPNWLAFFLAFTESQGKLTFTLDGTFAFQ